MKEKLAEIISVMNGMDVAECIAMICTLIDAVSLMSDLDTDAIMRLVRLANHEINEEENIPIEYCD